MLNHCLSGLENEKPCQSTEDYHKDGVKLVDACADEGEDEEDDARNEMEQIVGWRTEVFLRNEEHCRSGYESDYGRTERTEDVIDKL
jgi:hypothetical protein